MLNWENIKLLLQDCRIPYSLQGLQSVDSTNLEIRRAAMAQKPHGMVIAAEQQLEGRGRSGRRWESPPGENLYFSMLLLPDFPQEKASMLTLLTALSVAEALCRIGFDAKIKWPNDVVIDGCKVCGILTELGWRTDGRYFVVIGTGINVNQRIFADEIAQTATSLFLQKGEPVERETLLASVLQLFSFYYDQFAQQGDLGSLRAAYEEILVNRDQQVKVLDPKGAWLGTALGITDTGELLVRHEDGTVEAVYAGEVSVRGIYGYV